MAAAALRWISVGLLWASLVAGLTLAPSFWRAPAQNAEILAYLEAGGSFSDLCPTPGDSLPMAEHCPLFVLAQLALLPEHASAPKDPGYCQYLGRMALALALPPDRSGTGGPGNRPPPSGA